MNLRNSSLALLLFLAACNGSNSSAPQTDTSQADAITPDDGTFGDLAKAKDELAAVVAQKAQTQADLDALNVQTAAAKHTLDELTRTDPTNPGLLALAQKALDEKNSALAILKGEGKGSLKQATDTLATLQDQVEAARQDIAAKTIELDNLTRTDQGNPGLIASKTRELAEKKAELDNLIRTDPANPGAIVKAQMELTERTGKLAILDGEGAGSIKEAQTRRDEILQQIAGLTTEAGKLTASNKAQELKTAGNVTGAAEVLKQAGLFKEAADVLSAGGFRPEAAEMLKAGGFQTEADALLAQLAAEKPVPAVDKVFDDKTVYTMRPIRALLWTRSTKQPPSRITK